MSDSNYGIEITPAGVKIKDADEIFNERARDWKDAFALKNKSANMDKHTPQGQIAVSEAAAINAKNIALLKISNMFNVDKATGIFQDALYNIFGLKRKAAIPTTVNVICSGLSGTQINGKETANPSKIEDAQGNMYVAQTSAVIGESGSISVIFENEKVGSIPCVANSINRISTTTAGWDGVSNPAEGIAGQEAEDDEDFRRRYKLLVANNASGDIGGMQSAILKLDGVLDALVIQNNLSVAGTILGYSLSANSYVLSVLGGNDDDIAKILLSKISMANQAGNTTVDVVEKESGKIYQMKFLRPAALNYFFNVEIVNDALLPADIEDKIKDAIYENFYDNRVRIGSTVYASRFSGAVSSKLPNVNILNLQIASKPDGGSRSAWGNSIRCLLAQYPATNKENILITRQ